MNSITAEQLRERLGRLGIEPDGQDPKDVLSPGITAANGQKIINELAEKSGVTLSDHKQPNNSVLYYQPEGPGLWT